MDDQETQAARQARQFTQLRRLGDIAIDLAEAAGSAALAEARQPPDPDAAPETAPAPRRSDHAHVFAQAANIIRQIIALELRVEAGPAARRSANGPPPLPDPRRPLLQRVLHDAVRNDPNRARRRREIDENIEQEILADPDADLPIAETLGNICTRLHIDVELSRVPDAFLDFDEPVKTDFRQKHRDADKIRTPPDHHGPRIVTRELNEPPPEDL